MTTKNISRNEEHKKKGLGWARGARDQTLRCRLSIASAGKDAKKQTKKNASLPKEKKKTFPYTYERDVGI